MASIRCGSTSFFQAFEQNVYISIENIYETFVSYGGAPNTFLLDLENAPSSIA